MEAVVPEDSPLADYLEGLFAFQQRRVVDTGLISLQEREARMSNELLILGKMHRQVLLVPPLRPVDDRAFEPNSDRSSLRHYN